MSEWDWELTDTSRRDFAGLDDHARDRIASKLDEIVTDECRDPPDHLELDRAVKNDKTASDLNRTVAFVQGHRYVSLSVLQDSPHYTTELEE